MLRRKDRSHLALPDPLPGLQHEWIETAPGIQCVEGGFMSVGWCVL